MPKYFFNQPESTYDLMPSLADSKSLRLSNKYAEKSEKLAPSPTQVGLTPNKLATADRIFREGDSGPGLLDMAESSIYQGAGNIADTYANIQQNVFGNPEYKLSPGIDALSNEQFADEKAGFTGREAFTKDVGALTESVAKEDKSLADYLRIAKQATQLGPRALADSAASGLELGVGALATAGITATAGPVAGAVTAGAIFGKKAKKAADKVEKVVSLVDRIKKGAKAVPSVIAKSAGRTSLLTADITEQMRQDYKVANNGQEPSAAWYATNVPITMALNAIEFGLISKAIPKFSKPTIKDMKETVKFMSKKHSVEAARRIFAATGKIAKAASAEAGQEYLQTWHEILAPVVEGDSLNEMVTTAAQALGKDKNQTEAIVGSLLGFSAGGTARGIAAAPSVATGLAADATKGTVKATVNTTGAVLKAANRGLKNAQNKASLKVLSEEDREVIRNDYEIEKTLVDEKTSEIDSKIEIVKNAKSFEDITADEELASVVKENQDDLNLTDDDLNDPGNLQKLKDKIVRKQEAAKLLLKATLEASNAAAVVKQTSKNVKNITVETAKAAIEAIPEEVAIKAVEAAVATKEGAEAAVKAVKGLRSSAAYGLVEMGLKATGTEAKIVYEAAKDLDTSDLKKVASVISESNPDLGKQLTKLYETKKEALVNFKLATTDLTTEKNLSPVIKNIAEKGSIEDQSIAAVSKEIKKAMTSKIGDKGALAVIRKAIEVYKKSDTKNSKGRISDTSMKVIERRLDAAEKRLDRDITRENVTAVVDKVKDKVSTATEAVKKAAEPLVAKVKSALKEQKELAEGPLKTAFVGVEKAIEQGPKAIADLIPQVNKMVAKLKEAGYETVSDLNDLVSQFPGLAKNAEFYDILKSKFETDVITNEKSDTVESNSVVDKVFDVFEKLIPGCKK